MKLEWPLAVPRAGWLIALQSREVVPPVGIEPTLLSEPDFESGASTSSTTGAAAEAWADLREIGPCRQTRYCGVSFSLPLPFWPATVQLPSSEPSSLT
jgi:hypothetical protein